MKQNFEKIIRDSVNNHEMPYENGAWESFQKNVTKASPFYTTKWFAVIVISAVVLTTFFAIMGIQETQSPTQVKSSMPLSLNTETVDIKNTMPVEDLEKIETNTTQLKHPNKKPRETTPTKELIPTTNPIVPKKQKTNDSLALKQPNNPTNKDVDQPQLSTESNSAATAKFYLPKTVCSGETIYLTSEENNITRSYQWQINNKIRLSGSIQKFTPRAEGLETITLLIYDEEGNKLAEQTKSIEIKSAPKLTLEIENDQNSIKNNYNLNVFNSNNENLYWDLGDGTKSNQKEVYHTYKKAGIYTVSCKSKTQFGCESSVETKIEIPGIYNFRKDYGFSPNGDNINDYFIPVELSTLGVNFTMNIYARSGQLIYSSNSRENPWNGMLANGTRCPFGSYVWVVSLTNEFGNEEIYKGTVTNVSN